VAQWRWEPVEDNRTRVAAMLAEGYTRTEIAAATGLSRSRISRLAQDAAPRPPVGNEREGNGQESGSGLWRESA
jgi:hypothetical protein